MKKWLLLAPLALAACGNLRNDFGNGLTPEDKAFALAIPRPGDVAVDAPDDESTTSGLSSRVDGLAQEICKGRQAVEIFCNGHAQAIGLNALTGQLLSLVDLVRRYPPTLRESHLRQWGPYPSDDKPGQSWMVRVERGRVDGALTYTWEISLQPFPGAEFVRVLYGVFHPGPGGSAKGAGEMSWDGKASREQLGDENADDLNLLTIGYDLMSTNRTIHALFVAAKDDGSDGVTVTFDSSRARNGSGSWHYNMAVDIDGGGVPDELDVKAQWNAKQAGRADAKVTLADSTVQFFVRECWNPFLIRTYFESPRFGECPRDMTEEDGICHAGREAFCVFDDLYGE